MKLTILNKLEKKLRASRGREVPDLKPPAGGWEAINARIATDPVGERAPVDQSTTPSWIKWWVGGMGVIILVIAAAFMPPNVKVTEKQEAVAPTQQVLAMTKVVDVEERMNTSEEKEMEQGEQQVIRNSEETDDPPVRVELAEMITPASKVRLSEQRSKTVAEQKDDKAQQESVAINNQSLGEAASNNEGSMIGEDETDQALPANRRDQPVSLAIDTSQLQTTALEPTFETFVDKHEAMYLPLELSSPLSGFTIPSSGQWPIEIMPTVPEMGGLFKRRRLKTRPEWQLHGSISGFVGEDFDGTLDYSVAPPGSSGTFFVRPSGGLIHVEPEAMRGNLNRLEQIYIKGGINRQTSSGFLFRSSIGMVRSKSFQIGRQGVLLPNQVEVKTAKSETIIPVELGLQYTFLRRRRIKPYAGVHLIGYLNYIGVDESHFTDGATAEEGLVSRYSNYDFLLLTPDLAVTLGLQYQLTNKISAGAFLWGNISGSFFVQAPLGLEIRYSLK